MKLSPRAVTAAAGIAAVGAILLLAPTIAPLNIDTTPPAPASSPHTDDALELLAGIPTPTATDGSYDRERFGPRWADVNHSGCDTRNEMLAQSMTEVVFKPGTHECVVLSGTFYDPYIGETVSFVRISEGYQPVQVDHVVSLSASWTVGSSHWTDEKRLQFANDPANLQVTTANQDKGDSTPSEWLPPADDYVCDYAIRYVTVTHAYELALTEPDRHTLEHILTKCSDQ